MEWKILCECGPISIGGGDGEGEEGSLYTCFDVITRLYISEKEAWIFFEVLAFSSQLKPFKKQSKRSD